MEKNRTTLALLFFLVAVPVIVGCADSDQIIERTIGGLIDAENASIEEARDREQRLADSLSLAHSGFEPREEEWPAEIPGYVPRLPGRISSVLSFPVEDGSHNYSIVFSDASGAGYDDFRRELISKGWDVEMDVATGNTWVVQAVYGQEAQISLVVSEDESAVFNLVLFP